VAAALETEHRAVGGQLGGASVTGGELELVIGDRVDVEVLDAGPAIDRTEVGFEHQVSGVRGPLKLIVGEGGARVGEGQALGAEYQRVLAGRRVEGPDFLGPLFALDVGIAFSTVDPRKSGEAE